MIYVEIKIIFYIFIKNWR